MQRTKMIVRGACALLLSLGAVSGPAAADGATLYKTKTCVACHGAAGGKPILPIYPKVGCQNEQYIVNQVKDIKSGTRANGQSAAMKGVMHLVSDEEISAIANWLSAQCGG